MKLEFERSAVSKELGEELDFAGFLSLFDLDLPLIPRKILRPLDQAEAKAHFRNLRDLESVLEREKGNLGRILAQCGQLPSIDYLAPFFKSGGLEQFHLHTLGNFVAEDTVLRQMEAGFPLSKDSEACDSILDILKSNMKSGFTGFCFTPREESLRLEIDNKREHIKSALSEYEKDIHDQTGLKMIYPYPREIPKNSESVEQIKKSGLVFLTPLDEAYSVDYLLTPYLDRLVREKEELSTELSRRMEKRLKRVNRDLTCFCKSFNEYARERKLRVFQYALIMAKKNHSLCFPEFCKTGLRFKRAVLPRLKKQRPGRYTPLTLDLNPGSNVLFGANMTGKTTVLKTLYFHLTAIRMGLPIPGESVSLRFPEQVEIQLKSSGSLKSNLSGFGEEIQFFTRPFSGSAYILVDELFQSTDPVSGAELSCLFLEEYSGKDTVFFCTSHYPEVLHMPEIEIFRMKDMGNGAGGPTDFKELMDKIPYDLEKIAPGDLGSALEQSKKPFRIALNFPLPESVKTKLRERLKIAPGSFRATRLKG